MRGWWWFGKKKKKKLVQSARSKCTDITKKSEKITNSRGLKNIERNCLNFSNKSTLNAGNFVIIAKLISSFLRGCIFGHFGHDYSKSGETERYLTILIALLFQRVLLYSTRSMQLGPFV